MSRTVAVVTNIPRPYRRALFAALREGLISHDLNLRIFYTSDPAKHVQRRGTLATSLADQEVEHYVSGISMGLAYDRVLSLPTGLGRALDQCKPLCVVAGGFGPAALLAKRWCQASRVPRIIWSGAWPGRDGSLGPVERATRKRLVRNAQAFIAYGTAAGDYLVSIGANHESVFYAWNTVDLEGIASAAAANRERRYALETKYKLAAKNLLFIGNLIASKGLPELISAAEELQSQKGDWALHLVGAGPLRERLETSVVESGIETMIRFHGLRSQRDVIELLGVADGLILPTKREAWGLVINEAMACGVPVVVSPLAGATRDLITDGVTGYIVEPSDTQGLAIIMSKLVAGDPDCLEVGRAGAIAVREKASINEAAKGFVAAILHAMNKNMQR